MLTTLGDLARAMGPPFAQAMRPLVMPALANLNDSKKHVREAVTTMLDAWVAVVPADRFLQQLAETCVSAKCSPDGTRVALAWLQQQVCCVGAGRTHYLQAWRGMVCIFLLLLKVVACIFILCIDLPSQVTGSAPLSGADLEPVLRICASAVKDKRSDVRADGEALVAATATVRFRALAVHAACIHETTVSRPTRKRRLARPSAAWTPPREPPPPRRCSAT